MVMTSEVKMLPCPFCGGQPSHDTTMDESLWSHDTVPYRRVYCHACEIGTEYVCEGREPTEIEAWNRRTPAAEVAGSSDREDAIAWEAPEGLGIVRFVSDRRYQLFSPKIRAWYKPYRCSQCTSPPPTAEVEKCKRCGGHGWVMVGHGETAPAISPCPVCVGGQNV